MKIAFPKLSLRKFSLPRFTPWMAWILVLIINPGRRCNRWNNGPMEGAFIDQP